MSTVKTITAYEKGAHPFPKDEIDPKEKNEQWGKKFCEAAYAEWVSNLSAVPYSSLEEMRTLRRYAEGNQDVSKYQKIFLDEAEDGADKEGYMNVNWEILAVAPKFLHIVVGMFESQDHNVVATAVDPASSGMKEKAKLLTWIKSMFKDELQQIGAALGEVNPRTGFMPESVEELELYSESGGFKLAKEMEIEQGLNYTYHISDWPEVKRRLIHDFLAMNCAATKDYVDPYTRKAKVRYVDPEYFIGDYSRKPNHDNMEYAGELTRVSISDLRKYTELGEEKLRNLAHFYNGKPGNSNLHSWLESDLSQNDGSWKYDQFKIDVVDLEWFSINDKYYLKRTNDHGETLTYEGKWGKTVNTEKKKTEIKRYKTVYKCKWIVGTDYVYDFGLQHDVPRPGKKEVELSYSFYKLPGRSMVSRMVQNLDSIQLTWLKLQNAIAKSAPAGIAVEYTALNNMTLGGNKMTPLEILNIKAATGDLIYKSTTHRGQMNIPAGFKPVQELAGGIGPQLNELITILDTNINLIRDMTGINRVADASDPNPEQSVGGSELAVAGTNNALREIYSGYIWLKEHTARKSALRIQLLIKHDKKAYEGYIPVVGRIGVKTLSLGAEHIDANYFIKIEAKPTDARKQKIREAATAAMQPSRDGHAALEYPDWLLIDRALEDGNLKFAESYLNYKNTQSKRESAQREERNQKINGENAKALEQEKQKTMQTKTQLETEQKLMLEREKARLEDENNERQHQREMERIRMEKSMEPSQSEVA